MAGFRKAKAEQAALKMALYGPPGRGKTLTALLIAEGLAQPAKKRIAYVDTERGTDFYCKPVPQRAVHPEAFDFDAIYTRSLTDVCESIRTLRADDYAVVVIDSMTHLWEAAIAAYQGRTTSIGSIPMHAWGGIKKPYKDLIRYLLSAPYHVIICGRQGNEFGEDEDGELKKIGVKMKAEGETAYEPHILIRMESQRDENGVDHIFAIAEKDRSGCLAGRRIQLWPAPDKAKGNYTYQALAAPLLPLLGGVQATMETDDETATKDAAAFADAEQTKMQESEKLLQKFGAKIQLCESPEELKALGKEITADLKKRMVPAHVTELRQRYQEAEKHLGRAVLDAV